MLEYIESKFVRNTPSYPVQRTLMRRLLNAEHDRSPYGEELPDSMLNEALLADNLEWEEPLTKFDINEDEDAYEHILETTDKWYTDLLKKTVARFKEIDEKKKKETDRHKSFINKIREAKRATGKPSIPPPEIEFLPPVPIYPPTKKSTYYTSPSGYLDNILIQVKDKPKIAEAAKHYFTALVNNKTMTLKQKRTIGNAYVVLLADQFPDGIPIPFPPELINPLQNPVNFNYDDVELPDIVE